MKVNLRRPSFCDCPHSTVGRSLRHHHADTVPLDSSQFWTRKGGSLRQKRQSPLHEQLQTVDHTRRGPLHMIRPEFFTLLVHVNFVTPYR